jgi:hypothetical protein
MVSKVSDNTNGRVSWELVRHTYRSEEKRAAVCNGDRLSTEDE